MSTICEVREAPCACPPSEAFARDVLAGLCDAPKRIPSLYFYDTRGSRLFQRITELDEYYLTRCEQEILETHASRIVAMLSSKRIRIVDAGAGDGRKTEVLLRAMLDAGLDFEYVPIDICRQAVDQLAANLHGKLGHAGLRLRGIVADYFDAFNLLRDDASVQTLVLFLGSNIGNFDVPQAQRFLAGLRDSLCPGDYALIGFDLKKDPRIIEPAYDDAAGVTREFNLNLLDRMNRELGGHFDRRQFAHHAFYNSYDGCMESWLVSRDGQTVAIDALDREFSFHACEGIKVECSFKYDLEQIESFSAASGFQVCRHFFDRRRYFVDALWEAV